MGPKKVVGKERTKKVTRITIDQKKKIIEEYEGGVRVSDLAKRYGKAMSTICSILGRKEIIKDANVAKGVTVLTKQRSQTIDNVEKLLLLWIKEKQAAGEPVTETIVCEKARQLHGDLLKNTPGEKEETFKASRGWFENFKRRSEVFRDSKEEDSGGPVGERFVAEFKDFVNGEGYLPQQVFNCDKLGLFWKRMTRRTYITQEEKAQPGHKPMKDRLTLLLGSNASGDLKLKPLLVYHSDNPRVFKKYNVQKNTLNVMWRSNGMARLTRQFFIEWMNEVLGPNVKRFLTERGLALKAVLILSDTSAHSTGVEDGLLEEFSFITIKFLPPYLTPFLQPINQDVISDFKMVYTKALFQRCYEATLNSTFTLREYWKNEFNILTCLSLIDKAWDGVSQRVLNTGWKKLWSDAVPDWEPENTTPIVQEIVSIGKALRLEINTRDVKELLEEHSTEYSTEELEQLHREQQPEVSSGEEESGEDVPFALIKQQCAAWEDLQSFVEKYHPDKAAASRGINIFNDGVMSHFRQVLKRRGKVPAVKFVVKQEPGEPEPGPSGESQAFFPVEGHFLFQK